MFDHSFFVSHDKRPAVMINHMVRCVRILIIFNLPVNIEILMK